MRFRMWFWNFNKHCTYCKYFTLTHYTKYTRPSLSPHSALTLYIRYTYDSNTLNFYQLVHFQDLLHILHSHILPKYVSVLLELHMLNTIIHCKCFTLTDYTKYTCASLSPHSTLTLCTKYTYDCNTLNFDQLQHLGHLLHILHSHFQAYVVSVLLALI